MAVDVQNFVKLYTSAISMSKKHFGLFTFVQVDRYVICDSASLRARFLI